MKQRILTLDESISELFKIISKDELALKKLLRDKKDKIEDKDSHNFANTYGYNELEALNHIFINATQALSKNI